MAQPITAEKFFRKTRSDNGCWIFTGFCDRKGYGEQPYKNKKWRAHRLAWFFVYGEPGDLMVCHECDNPPCINPEHLFLGTAKDNADDMCNKRRDRGRTRPETYKTGEQWCRTKLSNDQVLSIKKLYDDGMHTRTIAEQFCVSNTQIRNILLGRQRIDKRTT